jgi:hypothetical protein
MKNGRRTTQQVKKLQMWERHRPQWVIFACHLMVPK